MATPGDSSDRRSRILDAAFDRFARYGFRRTGMADIAEAASLSRTALYSYFKNKEEIFSALSRRINERVVLAIEDAVRSDGDLAARLVAVLLARGGWAFDLLHSSEHGRELVDEKNRLCAPSSVETNQRFAAVLAAMLRKGQRAGELDLRSSAMDPDEAARFLVDCAAGLVAGESSEEHARARIEQLVRVALRGLR